jgi:hypothetical protein
VPSYSGLLRKARGVPIAVQQHSSEVLLKTTVSTIKVMTKPRTAEKGSEVIIALMFGKCVLFVTSIRSYLQ